MYADTEKVTSKVLKKTTKSTGDGNITRRSHISYLESPLFIGHIVHIFFESELQ